LLACAGPGPALSYGIVETGVSAPYCKQHKDNVRHIAFNANGEIVGIGRSDTTLRYLGWVSRTARSSAFPRMRLTSSTGMVRRILESQTALALEILRIATGRRMPVLDV